METEIDGVPFHIAGRSTSAVVDFFGRFFLGSLPLVFEFPRSPNQICSSSSATLKPDMRQMTQGRWFRQDKPRKEVTAVFEKKKYS